MGGWTLIRIGHGTVIIFLFIGSSNTVCVAKVPFNTVHRIRAVTLPPLTNPQSAPLVLFLIVSFPFG